MGKGRVRVKGGKAKRWRKGQSSLSNPSKVSHRLAARGKFGNHLTEVKCSVTLTKEVLAQHHTTEEEREMEYDRDEEDVEIETSAASSTALTLIETSHPVFGCVKKLWNSPTDSHRVICAVLAAVSEVVQSQDGETTETKYFAALMSVLESCDDEKSVAAISYLLTLIMPSLTAEVLQVKYSTCCKILTDQLSQHQNSSSTALLKSLIKALGQLLSVQPVTVWSDSHCLKVYQIILNFTIHPKPKLRKAARAVVVSMLREGSLSGDNPHIASYSTATHCTYIINRGGEVPILHILGLLRECMANLATQHIKAVCEAILKAMTLGNSMMRTIGLRAIHGAVTSVAGPQGLTASLTAKIISALYDHQPAVADWQLLMSWLVTLQAVLTRLLSLDQDLCSAHLMKFFRTAVSCLLSHSSTLTLSSANAMQTILTDVVKSLDMSSSSSQRLIGDLYKCVVKGLDYEYRESWSHVLKTLTVFHRVAGEHCHSFMAQSLSTVCSLYSLPDFNLIGQLEETVGAAISTMGPEVVLKYVPLHLDTVDDKPSLPHAWLLPVLRDHTHQSHLAYFRDHLLPTAARLRSKADLYRQKGMTLSWKLHNNLYHQVWSLLPGFCRGPHDVKDVFPSVARILGTALTTQPELRVTIATGLKHLVEFSRGEEEEEKVVGQFSKNYLPILFNLYTNDKKEEEEEEEKEEEGERQAIIQCIEAYISITDSSLITSFTSTALHRLSESDIPTKRKYRLLDVVAVLATALPLSSLPHLLQMISPLLDSGDVRLQKKGYKVVQQVLSCSREAHQLYVQQELQSLVDLLSDSLSTASPGSKKLRLRCLLCLVDHIGPEFHQFLSSLTSEVIQCTKETNEKCRILAFQLLIRMGHASQRCYGLNPEKSITRYLEVIMSGLTGPPYLVSASVISLSSLLFEFKDVVNCDLVSRLLNTVCSLLSSQSREVVKAAFGFIKITIRVLPSADLVPHLEDLIAGVLQWSSDPKSHFRLKARVIIERLCRKFGYEMIGSLTPTKHQKLLTHIRKTTERSKRRKMDDKDDDDDSEERDEEEHDKERKSWKKRGVASWIKESDDPVDFLDSSLPTKISATNPGDMKTIDISSFPTSADGKLVISDQPSQPDNSQDKMELDESQRKRKRDQDNEGSLMGGVRGGGCGIHRLKPNKMEFDYGSEFRSKKARGDVKVKGRPEPYAYVPLLGEKLNRRKRAKLSGQFKSLVKSARTGAVTGAKGQRSWRRK